MRRASILLIGNQNGSTRDRLNFLWFLRGKIVFHQRDNLEGEDFFEAEEIIWRICNKFFLPKLSNCFLMNVFFFKQKIWLNLREKLFESPEFWDKKLYLFSLIQFSRVKIQSTDYTSQKGFILLVLIQLCKPLLW